MIAVVSIFAWGCGSGDDGGGKGTSSGGSETGEIVVQHVLIAFRGSVPGKPVTRTMDEARSLAEEVFNKAKAGDDFDALVRDYTDDSAPGIYAMADFEVPADPTRHVYSRGAMIPAFGDVGFALKVGEIGIAPYDAQKSPYGWHIIKRIQ